MTLTLSRQEPEMGVGNSNMCTTTCFNAIVHYVPLHNYLACYRGMEASCCENELILNWTEWWTGWWQIHDLNSCTIIVLLSRQTNRSVLRIFNLEIIIIYNQEVQCNQSFIDSINTSLICTYTTGMWVYSCLRGLFLPGPCLLSAVCLLYHLWVYYWLHDTYDDISLTYR